MNVNKVLNAIAWITFALAVLSYLLEDVVPVEACFLVLVSIFLVIAPRHIGEAFN